MTTFGEALLQLADDENLVLNNMQRNKLRRIAKNKRRCRRVEERCELEARRDKKCARKLRTCDGGYGDGDRYGFDWSGLLEFLKGLLTIILGFIDELK